MAKDSKPGGILADKYQIPLLLLVFIAPIVVAFFWKPTSFMNSGELINPPRAITDVTLQSLDGKPVKFSDLKSKWTLIYFGPAACKKDSPCPASLYKMRQVRLAQGKNADRVQYVFVVTDPKGLDKLRAMLPDYPTMRVLTGAPKAIKALSDQFALKQGTPLEGTGRIYMVDPLGNLMMSYTADADATGMRKDLNRLLRVSRAG
jgi:cytochrome oxidase Cu insertion factor (SCO1/SenC/PrrC family)